VGIEKSPGHSARVSPRNLPQAQSPAPPGVGTPDTLPGGHRLPTPDSWGDPGRVAVGQSMGDSPRATGGRRVPSPTLPACAHELHGRASDRRVRRVFWGKYPGWVKTWKPEILKTWECQDFTFPMRSSGVHSGGYGRSVIDTEETFAGLARLGRNQHIADQNSCTGTTARFLKSGRSSVVTRPTGGYCSARTLRGIG
jgi:hypothetical protein